MTLDMYGRWEVRQLLPYLQTIVEKYLENLDGTSMVDSMHLGGVVTESENEELAS